jgi:hypothetical protein
MYKKELTILTSKLFLYVTDWTEQHVFVSNGKIEISVQHIIQVYAIPFMYFILQAWRWPSEVVTCCQIKDIKLTSSVNGSLFLMLLYVT